MFLSSPQTSRLFPWQREAPISDPVRLLAIDPSLTATGFLTAILLGYNRLDFRDAGTVEPKPRDAIATRLAALQDATVQWLELAAGRGQAPDRFYVVIEDPLFQSSSVRRTPVSTHLLGAAFGVVAATCAAAFPAYLRDLHVQAVRVGRYYPRIAGFEHVRKPQVEAWARTLLPQPLSKSSEHVCMAAALAHWWSHQATAARLAAPPAGAPA